MKLKRIDAFDVNYVDSAARKEFKLTSSTGTGESRIYIGKDEKRYDGFFEFANIEYFITEKKDLKKYLEDAYDEYMSPSQNYSIDITKIYDELKNDTNNIPKDFLTYKFRKKFDNQKRYYIVLTKDKNNKENYKYIRNIALPRVTKFCFIKFEDKETGKKYIYMRPIFFNDLKVKEEIVTLGFDEKSNEKRKTKRLKQKEFRQKVLEYMPFCPFTLVADDRILEVCHIKPFSVCINDKERYDCKNAITMTPTYHALFDLGFISFKDNGELLISPFLSNITKKRLNLKEGQRIRLQAGSKKYLEYHRNNIFCKMPDIELEVEE